MTVPRVELCDPGPEGQRIAEMLRERGFYVVERSIDSLGQGTEAALLLLAGDAAGAVEALRAVRAAAATATTPVILIGEPELADRSQDAILSLGADAFYPRPVAIERLVRKVETFLAPPETRLKPPPSVPPEQDPGRQRERTMRLSEPSLPEWRPPERTMELSEPQSDPGPPVRLRSTTPPPVSTTSSPSSPPPDRSDSEAPAAGTAPLSPRLRRLILDADRRVFPASPPLDLRFPAGDEPAAELVPDELLELVSAPAEPVEDDPLDAFTYIGPVPEHSVTPLPGGAPDPNRLWLNAASDGYLFAEPGDARAHSRLSTPPPVGRRGPRAESSPPPRTAATFAPPRSSRARQTPVSDGAPRPVETVASTGSRSAVDTQDEIGLGEPTRGGRGRHGELGEADTFRLLWRVMETRDDVWLRLELDAGAPVRLRVADGELVALEAPVAVRVVDRLRREGRVGERATDEQGAVALLERRVLAGLLGRFELDRMLRRARETVLYDVVAASGGRFDLRPAGSSEAPGRRVLGAPLAAVLVEGARRRLSAARVRRLLGSGALAIRLTPIARSRFERMQLEPELVSLLERSDGVALDEVMGTASAEDGIAGAVYALVAASALRLVSAEQEVPAAGDPAGAVRDAVEAQAALAEDGHYFDILGVSPHASPRELREAHEGRRRELLGLRLGALGLEDLEARRRLALEALDEAWGVLRVVRLRDSYRAALGL